MACPRGSVACPRSKTPAMYALVQQNSVQSGQKICVRIFHRDVRTAKAGRKFRMCPLYSVYTSGSKNIT